jgi:hypothetical protein
LLHCIEVSVGWRLLRSSEVGVDNIKNVSDHASMAKHSVSSSLDHKQTAVISSPSNWTHVRLRVF